MSSSTGFPLETTKKEGVANHMKGKTMAKRGRKHVAPKETLTAMKARGATKEEWGLLYFDKDCVCEKEGCGMKFSRAMVKERHYKTRCGKKENPQNKDETTGKEVVDVDVDEEKEDVKIGCSCSPLTTCRKCIATYMITQWSNSPRYYVPNNGGEANSRRWQRPKRKWIR